MDTSRLCTAYLQSHPLPEHLRCYMRPPRFLSDYLVRRFGEAPYDPSKHLFEVLGPVYGHPIAGNWWYQTLIPFVLELGFQATDYHPCFFVRPEDDGPPTIMISVVDNLPLAGQDHHVAQVRAALDARFEMTWDERADDVCGLYFDYLDDGSIFVHQHPYISKIATRLNLDPDDIGVGPPTPLDPEFNVDPNIPDATDDDTDYDLNGLKPREILGWFMYLRATVPTLSRAVHTLATATNVWQNKHSRRLFRIATWLIANQKSLGVLFRASYRGRLELRAFVDEILRKKRVCTGDLGDRGQTHTHKP